MVHMICFCYMTFNCRYIYGLLTSDINVYPFGMMMMMKMMMKMTMMTMMMTMMMMMMMMMAMMTHKKTHKKKTRKTKKKEGEEEVRNLEGDRILTERCDKGKFDRGRCER